MYGAWQAGVWRSLATRIQPDLIVGASIGSLNGWAVAGGCSPAELERYWMELEGAGKLRLRFPRRFTDGLVDCRELERTVRAFYLQWQPRIDYAVVLTDLLRLKPRIFKGPEVTAEHLLASCAVPGVFDQRWIGGRLYTDGGLLGAVPLWAATELGADRVIALDAMANLPSSILRYATRGLRGIARFRPQTGSAAIIRICPSKPLGSIREMLEWRKDRADEWIRLGETDGAQINISF
jgi:NTE family protein